MKPFQIIFTIGSPKNILSETLFPITKQTFNTALIDQEGKVMYKKIDFQKNKEKLKCVGCRECLKSKDPFSADII